MREIDRIECAAFGKAPKEALRDALFRSEVAWTATVDGLPEAMFGLVVSSVLDGKGQPWFLGSDLVYSHGRELLLYGPAMIARLADSTPVLENLVSAGNVKAIRLLRRWGFDVDQETVTFGGVPFHHFRMNANVPARCPSTDCVHGP